MGWTMDELTQEIEALKQQVEKLDTRIDAAIYARDRVQAQIDTDKAYRDALQQRIIALMKQAAK